MRGAFLCSSEGRGLCLHRLHSAVVVSFHILAEAAAADTKETAEDWTSKERASLQQFQHCMASDWDRRHRGYKVAAASTRRQTYATASNSFSLRSSATVPLFSFCLSYANRTACAFYSNSKSSIVAYGSGSTTVRSRKHLGLPGYAPGNRSGSPRWQQKLQRRPLPGRR